MEVNFSIINFVILFGALQGFTLCGVLFYQKGKWTKRLFFLLLFLFSISFLNLFYALLDANVLWLYKPLYLFPFPYKYLIGVAFWFYVMYSFSSTSGLFVRKWFWLFIPAIIYGGLHLYWFSISVMENSYRITRELVQSDFFRYNEFVYLIFTIVLISAALRKLNQYQRTISFSKSSKKRLLWLRSITLFFLFKTTLDLVFYSTDLLIHNGKETLLFYYPNFILNSLFIYYIGFVGFTRSHVLLDKIETSKIPENRMLRIEEKLHNAMLKMTLYTNKKISVSIVADTIKISDKELSNHIRQYHGINFSEYINRWRVNRVKELIEKSGEKFTLDSLGDQAGFNSRSAFYSAFKKIEGVTPAAYRKTRS